MRFLSGCLSAVVVWLLAAVPAMAGEAYSSPADIRLQHGDDPRWAAPDWDDSDWQRIAPDEVPARAGVFWLRYRVEPPSRAQPVMRPDDIFAWPHADPDAPIDAVFLGAVYSFEFFWDGRLLRRSGVVASSRDEEQTGPLDHLIRIPDELLGPGEHVVALRISSYHYNFPVPQFQPGFKLVNAAQRLAFEARRPIFPLIGVVGSLVIAGVSAVLFRFAERRRPLLWCAVLGVTLAVFYGLVALRWIYAAPYDWHYPRLVAITVVLTLIGVMLPWLLLEQFAVTRRRVWLAATVVLLAGAWAMSPWYETKVLWLCRAMLAVSLAIAAWAAWRRRPGAWFVLVGVAVGLALVRANPREFLDPTFFLIFGGLVLFVFTMLGAQMRAERERAREATLTAARLEIELLKKNIQPHFLLNTLATIMEVVEQDPRTAATLVEALAGEFRILARVSGEKLIPLAQEIELCRAHLRIMSLRKGARCTLTVEGSDAGLCVPPALLHTLVENGLTHLRPRDGEQGFALAIGRAEGRTRYTLVARGEPAGEPEEPAREGTGMRYVKARLEESFTGRWTLDAGPVEGGWRTVIDVEDASAAAASVETKPAAGETWAERAAARGGAAT